MGKKVWIGYDRMYVEGKWWRWNKKLKRLVDGAGKVKYLKGEGEEEERAKKTGM